MVSRPPPATRDAFKLYRTFTTRWSDNDVYGHVNNTVYYGWFDSAVNAWLVERGLLDIVHGDPIALVAETRCTYHDSLAFPGDVDVGIAVAEVGNSSVRYHIGVFGRGQATAAAEGEFVHVAVDRHDRRPVRWPEAWREAFAAIS